jgi:hypothetical protein
VRDFALYWATALTPVAFVAVGELSDAVGVRAVMAVCGLAAMALTIAILFVPGIRDIENEVSLSGM